MNPEHASLRPQPSGCHGYLAIEGLVVLADLLPLPVAPGNNQLQDGLPCHCLERGEALIFLLPCLQEAQQGCSLQSSVSA